MYFVVFLFTYPALLFYSPWIKELDLAKSPFQAPRTTFSILKKKMSNVSQSDL